MTNVLQSSQTQNSFIPGQVALHNKAIDILGLMQQCITKIKKLKIQIDNMSADYDHMPALFHPEVKESIEKVVHLHNYQVLVYRRILRWYLNTLTKGYDPALYHNHDFYVMPDARKNVVAA